MWWISLSSVRVNLPDFFKRSFLFEDLTMVTHNDSVSMIKINLQLALYQITCFVAILRDMHVYFPSMISTYYYKGKDNIILQTIFFRTMQVYSNLLAKYQQKCLICLKSYCKPVEWQERKEYFYVYEYQRFGNQLGIVLLQYYQLY